MNAVTDAAVREITFMKPTRIGGTEGLIDNALAYYIDRDPGPVEVVFPSKSKSREWSKTKFDPMVRDMRSIGNKLHAVPLSPQEKRGRREKSDEILFKTFDGGFLIIATAQSEHTFQMNTIKAMMLSDLDDFPINIGQSGNPVDLARDRLVNYPTTHKFIKEGKPKVEGSSLITREYEASDKSHYYVRCPGCSELRTMMFSDKSYFRKNNYEPKLPAMFLKYDKDGVVAGNPDAAWFVCEACGAIFQERGKMEWMNKTGTWIPERPHIRSHRGFQVGAWVSAWMTWQQIALDWIRSSHNRESRQVVVNSKFAEPFEYEEGITVRTGALQPLVESYEKLPAGVVLLTGQIDVQKEWIALEILGWGADKECWQWDYATFEGSPAQPKVWKDAFEYLNLQWPHELGFQKGIDIEVIDTGYSATEVYRQIKQRMMDGHRCYGIKGKGGEGKRLLYALTRKNKEKIPLWTLGVDAGKDEVMDALKMMLSGKDLNGTERDSDARGGPSWMHFREGVATDEYFEGLVSEVKRPKRDQKGFIHWSWEKKTENTRNEPLDLRVYGFAAREMWKGNFEREAAKLKAMAEEKKSGSAKKEPEKPKGFEVKKKTFGPNRGGGWSVNPFGKKW